MDRNKRNTLKLIGATAIGGLSASAVAVAGERSFAGSNAVAGSAKPLPVLSQVEVASRISSQHNDLEIVLTNTGEQTISVTQITPSMVDTPRGSFDLAAVSRGRPSLAAGQSIRIPMRRHAVVLNDSSRAQRGQSLEKILRERMSIITESDAFAALSFVPSTVMS
ncbi:MAG: hypothetical protein V3U76_18140 [Granulosicoccus sp.]